MHFVHSAHSLHSIPSLCQNPQHWCQSFVSRLSSRLEWDFLIGKHLSRDVLTNHCWHSWFVFSPGGIFAVRVYNMYFLWVILITSLTAFALCLLCAVVNKRVTHLKHRKITVSPAASHSGGVFSPPSYYYPPSPLLYTSDTVRLNFTSCHSARMASLPSHPLTLTCTNTQTHKLAARGGAKRWRCSGPVMTRPSCKHLALCVCTCVCTRVCVWDT